MENDETPVGEGLRRDPTESAANEEVRQFPHRLASYFPAIPTLLQIQNLDISESNLPEYCYIVL
ncbi:hypothetical protein HM131_11280 [Halobacillus mangrovi]|uniref:Uncharacterized protein n=1 Tax=Halobacillus mangrovi TaxID=402384 RepID=A0A1W5ZVN2_9BACI|nr:hypothetical protein HM131_11280 [Halobacillus mangrovi]